MEETKNINKKRKPMLTFYMGIVLMLMLSVTVSGLYLNDLKDVNTDTAVNCNFLHYNGTAWVNYDLWNQSITWYKPQTFNDNITTLKYFIGDGSQLINLPGFSLPAYLTAYAHPHNQDLNTSSTVSFTKVTSVFWGDGGNLTDLPPQSLPIYLTIMGHPHNQDVNTTSDVNFHQITASHYIGLPWINPFNQILNTTSTVTFATVDTGQGANELYDMDQNMLTTSAPTFATVDTGQGANELYDMNQNVLTTSAPTFATVDTGQGANELYDMNQNVLTTSAVTFDNAVLTNLPKARAYVTGTNSYQQWLSWKKVNFSAENYDIGSNYDTSNYRYTAPVTGYYLVAYTVQANPFSDRYAFRCSIYVNGAQAGGYAWSYYSYGLPGTLTASASDILYVTSGQTIEVYAYAVGGTGTWAMTAGSANSYLAVCRIP